MTRWDAISASRVSTRSGMEWWLSRLMLWNGPGASATTRVARRKRLAPVIITGSRSMPIRSPNSLTSRAANES